MFHIWTRRKGEGIRSKQKVPASGIQIANRFQVGHLILGSDDRRELSYKQYFLYVSDKASAANTALAG